MSPPKAKNLVVLVVVNNNDIWRDCLGPAGPSASHRSRADFPERRLRPK